MSVTHCHKWGGGTLLLTCNGTKKNQKAVGQMQQEAFVGLRMVILNRKHNFQFPQEPGSDVLMPLKGITRSWEGHTGIPQASEYLIRL